MNRGNSRARRDYVTTLAWIIGCAGPIVGGATLMAGPELVFPIAVGSCLVAGLLFSVRHEGRAGAAFVLQVPLFFLIGFPAAWLLAVSEGSGSISDGLGVLALGAIASLVVGASIEVGYLSGRGVARLLGDRHAARG